MVFLLQSSENRNVQAIQVKLDELIRATEGARNSLIISEDLDLATLNKLSQDIKNEILPELKE